MTSDAVCRGTSQPYTPATGGERRPQGHYMTGELDWLTHLKASLKAEEVSHT